MYRYKRRVGDEAQMEKGESCTTYFYQLEKTKIRNRSRERLMKGKRLCKETNNKPENKHKHTICPNVEGVICNPKKICIIYNYKKIP